MWIFPDSNIPKHLTLIMMDANSYPYILDSTNTGPPTNENSLPISKVILMSLPHKKKLLNL